VVRYKKNEPRPGLIRVPKDETEPLKYWQAYVELPSIGATRRRRTKRSRDWEIASQMLEDMRSDFKENPGMSTRSLTVSAWMTIYLNQIASKKSRPKYLQNTRSLVRLYIVPAIGPIRLDKLTPADVRKVADTIMGKKLSSTTAHQAHRILSVALEYALREGHVTRNVAKLVDAPRIATTDLVALTADQAIHLIASSRDAGDPLWTLWATVLLTGARQGELLGLEVDRVADDHIDLAWQLQRLSWQHGCDPFCGRKRGSDCRQRRLEAPADWAHRHLIGGLWLTPPKSKSGTRIIPLVDPLRSILLSHIDEMAGQPNPFGLVWHTPNGAPIDPRDESEAWHAALSRAGLPSVRLHDGRHTTVDLLYEAGVEEDLISEIVGHSARAVTRGYKSKSRQVRKIAAMRQLSGLIVLPARKAIG